MLYILDILTCEKPDKSHNPVYLDHCYSKDCQTNTPDSSENSISPEVQHISSK